MREPTLFRHEGLSHTSFELRVPNEWIMEQSSIEGAKIKLAYLLMSMVLKELKLQDALNQFPGP